MKRAIVLLLLASPLTAQEFMRRESPIQTRFTPASSKTRPASSHVEAARKVAKAWVVQYAQDRPKTWKITGWDYRGTYSGPDSDGKTWTMYRMSFNPPVEDRRGAPQNEAYFGFDKERLAFPRETYSRGLPFPRVAAIVELGR